MTEASKPSFLDHFAVHLASRLLGHDHVTERLEQARMSFSEANRSSLRLYWRTPLLVKTGALTMLPSAWYKSRSETVFVDITFDFINREKEEAGHASVSMSIGALILVPSTSRDGVYVKGSPLAISELRNHAESISIDIDSTNPEPLANSTAKALLELTTAAQISVENVDAQQDFGVSQVSVPLTYADLQETGHLTIVPTRTSSLDSTAMEMLFSNIVRNEGFHGKSATDSANEKSAAVQQAFQKWWKEPSACRNRNTNNDNTRGTVKIENSDARTESDLSQTVRAKNDHYVETSALQNPVESTDKIKMESTSSNTTKLKEPSVTETKSVTQTAKARPAVIVARAAPTKRRKRGKVTYSKAQS